MVIKTNSASSVLSSGVAESDCCVGREDALFYDYM